jgi:autotransporter-associated beta strand protein
MNLVTRTTAIGLALLGWGLTSAATAAISVENAGTTAGNQVATLSGNLLTTNGAPTTVHVFWGAGDGGTDAAAWAYTNTISGLSGTGVFSVVTTVGLTFGVPYSFRCYATNATDAGWAATSSVFLSASPSPTGPVLANMEAWYDAGVGLMVDGGGVVTNWSDRSGKGYHADDAVGTPQFASNQVNGLPAVQFHGGNNRLNINQPLLPREEYIVFKSGKYALGGDANLFGNDWAGPFGQQNDSGYMFQNGTRKMWTGNIPLAVSQNGVVIGEGSANGHPYALSNVADYMVLKVNRRNYPSANGMIGRPNNSWGNGYVDVAEVIVYSAVNTAENEASIGGYLAAKYGIASAYPGFTSIANQAVSADFTESSATMNATFRGLASQFDVYVYWGTSDGGSNAAAWGHTNLVGSFTDVDTTNLSVHVNTLLAGSGYHYTFCARNPATNLWAAASQSFQTLGTPVVNNAGGANLIGPGSASLNGALTSGGAADVYFCWGSINAGTNNGPSAWQQVEPARSAYLQEPFSAAISGTLFGIPYYYTCYASNAFGTAWSPVTAFTTIRPVPLLVTDGLEGWYDAGKGVVTSGDNVLSWADQSGKGHHTTSVIGTPTFASGEINNQPAIKFHGGDNRLNINHAIVPREQYIVFRSGRYGYEPWNADLFGPAWGGPFGQQNNEGWMFESGQTRTWNQAANIPDAMTQNGTALPRVGSYFYLSDVDAYFVLKVNPQNYASAHCMLGRPNTSWGNGCVDVAEVLIYNTPLSTGDEARVGGYLAQKYGIATTYPPLPVPAIVNTGITDLTPDAATLNGTLYAPDSVYDVWVYWSTNAGGESASSWVAGDGGAQYMGTFTNVASTNLTHALSGLSPLTPYYYSYLASNAVEQLWSGAFTFSAASAPSIENRGVVDPGRAAATLRGELVQGGQADVYVCWGTQDAGTNSGTAAWQHVDALGTLGIGAVFSNAVQQAYFGISYYYRCFATNALGSDWSDTATRFTTTQPEGLVTDLPNLASLQVWYDASYGITEGGGNVTGWSDRSTNTRHLVSGAGTPKRLPNTLNGRPVVQFNSNGEQLDMADPTDEYFALETYLVFRSSYGTVFGPSWGSPFGSANGDDADRTWMLWDKNDRFWNSEPPSAVSHNGNTVASANNFEIGADVSQYMVLKVVSGPNSGTHVRPYVLGRMDGWANSAVDTAEIIAYNANLSAGEEDELGGYLAWKYGITTTYPAFSPPNGSTIVNALVSGVAPGQAQLNATLDSADAIYHVRAYWSTNDYGTNAAAWLADGAGAYVGVFTNVITGVSHVAGGLAAATDYYYTFRGTNDSAEIWGEPSMTFGSAGPPSVGNDGGATDLGIGTATLRGDITGGGGADVYICWGETDGGTNGGTAAWQFVAPIGTQIESVPFSKAVSGLYYGIGYAYRVFASNALGTAWSGVDTFMTLAPLGTSLVSLNWDFESGDLTGWTNVGATAGADTLFRNGYSPVSHSRIGPKQGTYYIDGYSSGQGNSDAWTGIIETEPFTLGDGARWTFVSGGGNVSWSGTPAAPGAVAGIALEREVSPGTWQNAIWQAGANNNSLIAQDHDLGAYAGDTVRIRIYDNTTGGWGWTGVDNLTVSSVVVGNGVGLDIRNTVAANSTATMADLGGVLDATQSVFTVTAYWSSNNNVDAAAWLADGDASSVPGGTYTNVLGQSVAGAATGLLPDTLYYYTLLAVNAATNLWATPNASFVSDRAPVLIGLSPTNTATGAEPNAYLEATFDEAIALVPGGTITITNLSDTTATTITVPDAQVSVSPASTLAIDLASNLNGNDTYAVRINGNTVADLNGDTFGGINDSTTWRFTVRTAEAVPPAIVSLSPSNSTVDLPITNILVASFDENIELLPGGSVILTNITAGTATHMTLPNAQIASAGVDLIITPSSDLVFGSTYAVLISSAAFEDGWGNDFSGITSTNIWAFTTESEPAIASLSPADNATGVALESDLSVTFNKDVVLISGGTITLKNLTDVTVTTFTLPDAQVSVAGALVTINPSADLTLGDQYSVRISSDAIDDLNGNSFVGISDDVTWNFTATTAAIAIYIGPNSSNQDRWNTTANWDLNTIPAGAMSAVIPEGKLATAWNDVTPTYIGDLTIGTNATVGIGWTTIRVGSYNALGTPGFTTIHMHQGAHINTRMGSTPTIPAIQLHGDAAYTLGSSTQPSADPTFAYGIRGPHTFTLRGKGGGDYYLPTSNSFAALVADPINGNNFNIHANVTGSLGSGDVTVRASPGSGTVTANLIINATNAMADTALLTLNGPNSGTKLTMNADDIIGGLVVDGRLQPAGTYGATSNSNVEHSVSWLAGEGILTVPEAPAEYWDLNAATAGAGGPTPNGSWDAASANWSTNAAGTNVTAVWTPGENAAFAAGADATGAYAVVVSGTQDIGGLVIEEGMVALTGRALRLTSDAAIKVAAGSTATVASVISNDATARRLSKIGEGSLTLSGTNGYMGVTRLEAGELSVASLANAGANSAMGAYAAAGPGGLKLVGGTLRYSGTDAVIDRGVTLMGNSTFDVSMPGTTLTLGDSECADFSSTLTLTGGAGSRLSMGRARLVEGQHLTLNPDTIPMTVASVQGYTSYPNPGPTVTLSGSTTGNVVTTTINHQNPPGAPFSRGLHVAKSGSGSWTVSGVVSVAGTVTINGGTLTLSGANSFNGQLTVASGMLSVPSVNDSNANGPLGRSTAAVILGASAGRTGWLQHTGTNVSSSTKPFTMASGGTGVFDIVSATAELTLSGAIGGSGAMTKTGAGTLLLAGLNSYSGDTRVEAGTLALGGSTTLSDASALWIESGAGVYLEAGINEVVTNLYFSGKQAYVGTWGSTAGSARNRDDVYFSGTGILTVLEGPEAPPASLMIIIR